MKSYIKILGPPLLESIRALESIAVDMPEVCIMDLILIRDMPRYLAKDIGGYTSVMPVFGSRRSAVRALSASPGKVLGSMISSLSGPRSPMRSS